MTNKPSQTFKISYFSLKLSFHTYFLHKIHQANQFRTNPTVKSFDIGEITTILKGFKILQVATSKNAGSQVFACQKNLRKCRSAGTCSLTLVISAKIAQKFAQIFIESNHHRDKRWGDCATLEAVINFFSPKAMKLRVWGFFGALNSIVLFIFLKNLCKPRFWALFNKIFAKKCDKIYLKSAESRF